jgi:hypothetical protein
MPEKHGYSRLSHKDPAHAVHIPLLAELFPTARFVHIIRHGRDLALSLVIFNSGATNLHCGPRDWNRVIAISRHERASLTD